MADVIRELEITVDRALADRVAELEAAIRRHRDYRGDDRCHLDDGELYAVLPEGDTRPRSDTLPTLDNCAKYLASRLDPAVEYVSPQRRIEELLADGKILAVRNVELNDENVRLRADLLAAFDRIAAQKDILEQRASRLGGGKFQSWKASEFETLHPDDILIKGGRKLRMPVRIMTEEEFQLALQCVNAFYSETIHDRGQRQADGPTAGTAPDGPERAAERDDDSLSFSLDPEAQQPP